MNWISLTNSNQLEEIIIDSNKNKILIFKHSTRCGISRMVLKNFEREYNISEEEIKTYFLDLLNFRELSSEIANKLNVTHQSPQLILLKNQLVLHHSSHGDIDANLLKDFI